MKKFIIFVVAVIMMAVGWFYPEVGMRDANEKVVASYVVTHKWAEGYSGKYSNGEDAYFRLKSVDRPVTINLRVAWHTYQDTDVGDRVSFDLPKSKHGMVESSIVTVIVFFFGILLLAALLLGLVVKGIMGLED